MLHLAFSFLLEGSRRNEDLSCLVEEPATVSDRKTLSREYGPPSGEAGSSPHDVTLRSPGSRDS